MQQIFVGQNCISDGCAIITGEDVHHLADVVRVSVGERLRITVEEQSAGAFGQPNRAGGQRSYLCEVERVDREKIVARILEEAATTETKNDIYLFQALPKGDRMETVIEKAVELGVHTVIPVEMKRCVVRWDEKKKAARLRRYQAIADSAAKQAKRSRVPMVYPVTGFAEALVMAQSCDVQLVPYECKEGMAATAEALGKIRPGRSVAVMIGPEGGFDETEIVRLSSAKTFDIISLGPRILRTDTAAVTAMSMVMLASEFAGMEAAGAEDGGH